MEIALALSGGGYRAAVYHIGVLSYLEKLQLKDNTKILNHVNIISGVSGGALTALLYACAELNGEDRVQSLRDLYKTITETNIAKLITEEFSHEAVEGKDAIQVWASIYDAKFFHGRKFGEIMEGVQQSHLHHVIASATDFSCGLPFRFQAAGQTARVGNHSHCLNREIAAELRLADILAASSCFPIVFEPIIYPKHFELPPRMKADQIRDLQQFGMMDGGMIDNQGIDAILRAEKHLKKQNRQVDLVILSDVASSHMKAYSPYTRKETKTGVLKRFWGFLVPRFDTIAKLQRFMCFLIVTLLFGACFSYIYDYRIVLGISCTLVVVLLVLSYSITWLNKKFNEQLSTYAGMTLKTNVALNVKFRSIVGFFMNRVKSTYTMANGAMMGHIRKKNVSGLHNDGWKKRVVFNAIYALTEGGSWNDSLRKNNCPQYMKPSVILQENSEKAASMPTTLWFTDENIQEKMPETILSCGQYTTCWNLLKFVKKLESRMPETNGHPLLMLEKQLRRDWERFNADPQCMVSRIKTKN